MHHHHPLLSTRMTPSWLYTVIRYKYRTERERGAWKVEKGSCRVRFSAGYLLGWRHELLTSSFGSGADSHWRLDPPLSLHHSQQNVSCHGLLDAGTHTYMGGVIAGFVIMTLTGCSGVAVGEALVLSCSQEGPALGAPGALHNTAIVVSGFLVALKESGHTHTHCPHPKINSSDRPSDLSVKTVHDSPQPTTGLLFL